MMTAGHIVGYRYRLEQPIAQGGMGEVWKATHTSLLFPVAIKFAKPGAGQARFLREAHIAANLRHPHVVSVMDEGTTEEGTPFLVMEYLQGQSLEARLCQEPPWSVRDLLRVMAQVLSALEAVHAQGVIHRDLKPENILLLPSTDGEHAKLLDFGVAHTCMSSKLAIPVSPLTITGCTVGTPWYMAPEQARGLEVSPAADLFSVGIILYRALTGRFPFEGTTLADIVLKSITTAPVAPHELRPELGEALSRVVIRALAVDPSQRFADARAMRESLQACEPPDVATMPLAPGAPQRAGAAASTSLPDDWRLPPVPVVVPAAAPQLANAAGPRRRLTLPEHPSAPELPASLGSTVATEIIPIGLRNAKTIKRVGVSLGLLCLVSAMGWFGTRTGDSDPSPLMGHHGAVDTLALPEAQQETPEPVAAAPTSGVLSASPQVAPKSARAAKAKRLPRAFRDPGF